MIFGGSLSVGTQSNQRIAEILAESEKAIREGNRQRAYELSLQATKVAPENLEAWYLRASLAPSLEERLFCVNCLSELCPDCQDKHHVAFGAVKELLDRDPFLAYLEETEALYRVINKNNQVLVIPKKRAATNPTEVERTGPLKAAYSLLMIAVFGLLLAGVGTLIFAPLTVLAALQAGPSLRSQADRVGFTVVILLAGMFFLVGLLFAYLFALHLIG
jgi:hypothetical protein